MVIVMCRDIIFVVETRTIRGKTFVATPVRQNGPGCAFERALRGGIPDHVCLFVPMPLVWRRLFFMFTSLLVLLRARVQCEQYMSNFCANITGRKFFQKVLSPFSFFFGDLSHYSQSIL